MALDLADRGKRVLLVSTDPASNLDEMLGVTLGDHPTPVPGAPNLSAMNIDPDRAAEDYRSRVLDQLDPTTPRTNARPSANSCPAPAPSRLPPSMTLWAC
ncbi:ArsA family ATPase [Gemmobacter lanyuensis]